MAFKDKFVEFQSLPVNDALALRQVNPERDVMAYHEIYADSDAFKYYSGYNHPPDDIAGVLGILQNQINAFQKTREYCWTITERPSDKAIGRIHFSNFENNNTAANIGYFLNRQYWRQGIITACIQPVVQFGFAYLELERIFTTVMIENIGSWRALEKNGFLREGTLRHCFQVKNNLHDCYLYAKLSTD